MFGIQTTEREAVSASNSVPKNGVRAKIKGLVRRVRKPRTIQIVTPRTSIEDARVIFGEGMHSIEHLMKYFLVSSALKKNPDLITVPFSTEQLNAMYGYTLLTLTFSAVISRKTSRLTSDVSIAKAISNSLSSSDQSGKQMYPRWELLMKGDLTPFLEKEAISRARTAGLQAIDASLQSYLSAQIIEGKLKKAQTSHFVRTVDFSIGKGKLVVVSVSKKRKTRIAVKVVKTPTDIPKAIAFVSGGK